MGLIGRIFRRKPGGSRLGNLLRQIAWNNTDGFLGQNLGEYGEILRVGQSEKVNQDLIR